MPYRNINSARYGLHYGAPSTLVPSDTVVLTNHSLAIDTNLPNGTGMPQFAVALGTGIGNTGGGSLTLMAMFGGDPNDPASDINSVLLDGVELIGQVFTPQSLVVGNNGQAPPPMSGAFCRRFDLVTEWLVNPSDPNNYQYQVLYTPVPGRVFANTVASTWSPQERVLPTMRGLGFLMGGIIGQPPASTTVSIRDPVTLTVLATASFSHSVTGI